AIQYLQKVKYTDQRKLNDLGLAYLKEKNFGTALGYLEKSAALDMRVNKTQKALFYYQMSLINLLPDFNATNIRVNPATFTTAFNGIELLETLSAKAKAFEALYAETKEAGDLEASLQ